MKIRILILTDWFVPGYKAGGPIQSCYNFSVAMKEKHNIYVLTTDKDLGEDAPYPGIVSNQWNATMERGIQIYYFSPDKLSSKNLVTVINGVAPDYIYLNHMFSPFFVLLPLWLSWKQKIRAKVVLCPRGALFASAMHYRNTFFKKWAVLKLIKILGIYKRITFHATNEREQNSIGKIFPTATICIADNLPNCDQPPFQSITKTKGILRSVFVGRIVPIKNLKFILEVLSKSKGEIYFTIVGPMENEAYWDECEAVISKLPENIQVTYLGPKSQQELHKILIDNHIYILPTKGENFGHSIFEALRCGRPALISDQTPWKKLTENRAGWDLSLDCPDQFVEAIDMAVSWSQAEFNDWAESAWNLASLFIERQSVEIEKYDRIFE